MTGEQRAEPFSLVLNLGGRRGERWCGIGEAASENSEAKPRGARRAGGATASAWVGCATLPSEVATAFRRPSAAVGAEGSEEAA
eukprot:scaffold78034_cov23-Tisochrysis_lutea.AAC.4